MKTYRSEDHMQWHWDIKVQCIIVYYIGRKEKYHHHQIIAERKQ